MQTCPNEIPSLSLVSWARTARPVRLKSPFASDARVQPTTDATDDVFFGVSTIALILAPIAALLVVVFG